MKNSVFATIGVCATALLGLCSGRPVQAQSVDPALAASWSFVQQTMPNISYDMLKAACAEGNLTYYHSTSHDPAINQVEQFKKRFPCINVQRFELNTGQLRLRFETESRAKRYIADLTQDDDLGSVDKEIAAGLIMNYTVSDDTKYPDSITRHGYAYPLQMVLVGIAWNTTLVTDEEAKTLQNWSGITNATWAGRAGIIDPSGGGLAALPVYVWPKLYGDKFFAAIGALKPRVFAASSPAGSTLASGDVAVVFNASDTNLMPLWTAGAPIKWSLPTPGIGVPTIQMVAAHAPHPNAAKLYQEYAFTSEGYAAWQAFGGAPTRIGFADLRKIAKEPWYKLPTSYYKYDTADVTASNAKNIGMFHTVVGSIK